MATLIEVYQMQGDATLKNRIAAAVAKKAWYILSTEDPGTANHAARVAWAKSALGNPETVANQLYWAAVQNSDIQAGNADDTTVSYVTETAIDVLALA